MDYSCDNTLCQLAGIHTAACVIRERAKQSKLATRLDSYQEALRFLEQMEDAGDQAHACMKDARVADINIMAGTYRVDCRALTGLVSNMLKAVREVECEDCDKPLVECDCAWLKERIR